YSPPALLPFPSPSKQQPLMMTGDRHTVPVPDVLVIRTPSCELRSVEQPTSLVASPKAPLWSMTQPLPAHRSARHPTYVMLPADPGSERKPAPSAAPSTAPACWARTL